MPVFARAPLVVREALIFPVPRRRRVHALVGRPRGRRTRCRTARGCRSPPSRSSIPSATPGATCRCRSPFPGQRRRVRGRARGERDPGAPRGAGRIGRSADRGADRMGRRPLPGLRHAGRARRWCGTSCGTTARSADRFLRQRGAGAPAARPSAATGRRSTRSRSAGGRRRGTCWRRGWAGGRGAGGRWSRGGAHGVRWECQRRSLEYSEGSCPGMAELARAGSLARLGMTSVAGRAP